MNFRPVVSSALAVSLFAAASSTASAGSLDPRGIYHNAFNGSFSGTEWFQVIPIAGTNRYRMADMFSGGFNGTITPGGTVTLDGGIGGGTFSSANNWIINPNLGGSPFTFNSMRAPDTTPDFPLELDSAAPANSVLSGTWRSNTQRLNPRTGAVLSSGFENVSITSTGTTFRITDPGGLFFQGVFETPTNIGFRFVTPTPSDARFRSFPGSSINFSQNMLGQATITSINSWEAIILLQSRASLGSQTQLAFRFTATRTNPLPEGDLNGDRTVDEDDRALIEAQVGLTNQDNGYNIAGDLDLDGDVDGDDIAIFDTILPPPVCLGDCDDSGSVDFNDLVSMLFVFGQDTGDACDTDGSGNIDFNDLVFALFMFGPCD